MQFDRLRRRELIATLLGAALGWPRRAVAQDKIPRVGLLASRLDNPITAQGHQILVAELRKLGFNDGQNLVIDHRRIDAGTAQAFAGANELVAGKVDVLLVSGAEIGLQAAAAARPAIPIVVLANNFDPIDRGYVASLSRPGGNITGVIYRQPELAAKQLELLAEAFPDRRRVGALWDSDTGDQFAGVQRAAKLMGLKLVTHKLESPPYDWEAAFRSLAKSEAEMLIVLSSARFAPHRARIAELANAHRLPSMYTFKYYVQVGGLMSYGVDIDPGWRRVASYVAKILRGARPADLAMEEITNFEMALNLKTAKTLGLTIPTSILLRADEVIE